MTGETTFNANIDPEHDVCNIKLDWDLFGMLNRGTACATEHMNNN